MDDDAGGLVAVGAAVFGQGVDQQLPGIGLGQVRLAVGLGDLGGATAHDDAVAALVEDLRDSGVQLLAIGGAVEADADVAGRQVRTVALHAPGSSASLVVQGGVQVPRPGGFVLQGPDRLPVLRRNPVQVSVRISCSGAPSLRAAALSRS